MAAAHGASPAQVALAWLLGRPAVTSLIIGARTDEQLRDNLGAASLALAKGVTAQPSILMPRALPPTGFYQGPLRSYAYRDENHRLQYGYRAVISLGEIGELLGHRSPETTKIYIKVDLDALRTLALPWPGGVR